MKVPKLFSYSPYTRRTMAAGQENHPVSSNKLSSKTIVGIVLVSLVYFADVFLKASRKCFWFDELFTVYLCRLPTFKATWTAVTHGADFNPPFLYLFTRWAQWLFGPGLIATRLPSMIGVWLFGVCLFLFVARRAGVVSGFIAGIFPFFTLAQYYAYEARSHGIVLGWCGLTLVCWQRNAEGRAKNLWLAGFGLCFAGALMTHVYAVYLLVPFALVEVYDLFHRGGPNWGIVAAMVVALLSVAVAVYLPLFRMYRAIAPSIFFAASHDLLQRFLVAVIGPAIGIVLLALILFALQGLGSGQPGFAISDNVKREMLVAAGFVCLPLAGLVGSKVSHGPFIERYFLSSIAGYAIFLGFASSRRQVASWSAPALAGCMLFLMIVDLGTTMYFRTKHADVLIEPSTGLGLSTRPANPMMLYGTVSSDHGGLDVLVLPSLEYIYFFRYAPSSVVSHLYFGAPANDINLRGYQKLAKEANIDLKITTFDTFLATHTRFLVYESAKDPNQDARLNALQTIAAAGCKLKSARGDVGGIMYEYAK